MLELALDLAIFWGLGFALGVIITDLVHNYVDEVVRKSRLEERSK